MPAKICDAVLCAYWGFDFSDCKVGVGGREELLCLTGETCFAIGEESLGCGIVTNEDNGEFCKIGIPCMTCGLKKPDTLCTFTSYCLCVQEVGSFPFKTGYVEEPTCAICCLSLMPEAGCCKEAKESKAMTSALKDYSFLKSQSMSR